MRLEFPLTFRATGARARGRTQGKLRVQALARVQEEDQVFSKTLCRSRHHHASRVLSQHVFDPMSRVGRAGWDRGWVWGQRLHVPTRKPLLGQALGAGLE